MLGIEHAQQTCSEGIVRSAGIGGAENTGMFGSTATNDTGMLGLLASGKRGDG